MQFLGQMVEHVAPFVLLAALHQRGGPQHFGDHSAQGLRPVNDPQPRRIGIQPTLDQIRHKCTHGPRLPGAAFADPEEVFPALGVARKLCAMKHFVRSLAKYFGYEIRKAPRVGFDAAPIFDLAIQYLMLRRGESLTFIQVGANDGTFGDPISKYVLQHKWTGVFVEPQPDVFEALKAKYAGLDYQLFFENVAISNSAREISLYRARNMFQNADLGKHFASSVASTNQDIVSKQLSLSRKDLEEIVVPAVRLDDLVEKYKLENFEILQVDTEGYDWQVLQTLDLSKVRPVIIQFEHGHLSPNDIGRIISHLNSHDYFVYYGGHQSDSVAMRHDLLY